jgi:putative colanic acid biosynthesis UDP-glucose lipid carrier transferase
MIQFQRHNQMNGVILRGSGYFSSFINVYVNASAGNRQSLQVKFIHDAWFNYRLCYSWKRAGLNKSNPLEVTGNAYAFLHRLADFCILIVVLIVSSQFYRGSFDKNDLLLLLAQIVVFSYIAEALDLYRFWRVGKFGKMLWLLLIILSCSFALMLCALFIFKSGAVYSRVVIGIWFAGSATLMLGWRMIYRLVRKVQLEHGINRQRVCIIGLTPRGVELYQEIKTRPELGLECIGFFDDREPDRFPAEFRSLLLGTVNDAVITAQSSIITSLYICLPLSADRRIQQIVQQLGDTTLNVYLVPELLIVNMMRGRLSNVGDVDTISVFESPHYGVQNYLKRTFDIVFSATALLMLFPLLLIIGIAVRLTSKGPAIFKQNRYGLDGKQIGVFKFRSMQVLENSDSVVQATKGDLRVTRFGAFLRRTSLDELPQFFNVLRGEMSVVGPRPHAVAHNEHYRNRVAFYMLRHKVKPGITGWAQVNGWRGETDTLDKMEKRIEFDLHYIRNWSLWWDVKIIIKTLFKGFGGKHVY